MKRLAMSKANVTPPHDAGRLDDVTVLVNPSAERLRIISRQGDSLVDVEATDVRIAEGSNSWWVDTPDGSFLVERSKRGCGCRG